MTVEQQHAASKCPVCGSTKLHSSRRRSVFEKLTAFVGISYFRCHECKLRFSTYMGGFASRSTRSKYLLFKQRAKELIAASVLLAIIVAALVGGAVPRWRGLVR
jgi:C4-type Zn-finger protein